MCLEKMRIHSFRNFVITLFVIIWTIIFHYESIRYFYLNPFFKRDLPQMKFLFPPAGWIMFFNVDDQFSYAEIYGMKNNQPWLIDPHLIFRTRPIGFDNIHRNVLIEALFANQQQPFCRYLKMKFPDFDNFLVTAVIYPSVAKTPLRRVQQVVYECR